MSRITLSICDRDHNALRLLSLYKNKKILLLVRDAIQQYLDRESAYDLEIRSASKEAIASNDAIGGNG